MTEAPTPMPPTGPRRRWLAPALFVSVAINLAVAGLVAGAVWHGGPPPEMALRDLSFGPFAAALTETDRAALRRAFMARNGDLRKDRREMRAAMVTLLAALRAEPFDPAALTRAVEATATHTLQRLRLGQELILDRVAAMSAEERAGFADRLEEVLRHGPPPRGENRADRPDPQK